MRVKSLLVSFLTIPIMSCTYDQNLEIGEEIDHLSHSDQSAFPVAVDPVTFELDLIQRTCALYVAVRSRAFQKAASFDTDLDKASIRWNMCSDGNMVACAKVLGADGDSVKVGIPWPYDVEGQF